MRVSYVCGRFIRIHCRLNTVLLLCSRFVARELFGLSVRWGIGIIEIFLVEGLGTWWYLHGRLSLIGYTVIYHKKSESFYIIFYFSKSNKCLDCQYLFSAPIWLWLNFLHTIWNKLVFAPGTNVYCSFLYVNWPSVYVYECN